MRENRDADPYRLYALVRADLPMGPGKIAAQAGHAFVDCVRKVQEMDSERVSTWHGAHHGIKIVLSIPDLAAMDQIREACVRLGLPHAYIVDHGYTVFEGVPTPTCIGIGPVKKNEVKSITSNLALLK